MEAEEDLKFLESVKDAINVPYDTVSDFTTCDFEKYVENIFKPTIHFSKLILNAFV